MKQKNVNMCDVKMAYETADDDLELWDRICGWFVDKADKMEEKAARIRKHKLNKMDADTAAC